ncbi:MAG: triphosphoribosyl-dephospho-CoA synthase [Alphaproteobacteria bacterium]|nr:triphosphoribosyl-dephospho-CoA synthase [Alphaproteobacteria bacterium]
MTPLCCRAFIAACRDELDAPKPGNVHVYAAGHRMTVAEFEDSAVAAAGPLCAQGARVGVRIRAAIEATNRAVGTNTNLGIVLLCAPLAAAAERALAAPAAAGGDLRACLTRVLDGLDVADAADAFAAIVQAAPAGLGHAAQHDVFAPPQVTLKEAMTAAADRDLVARQYATAFADVFDLGMPLHVAATARGRDPKLATLAVYLGFLSRFPDSHILRKHGAAAAREVRRTAQRFDALLDETGDPASLFPQLLAWDRSLKAQGLNPGSSADLTVATLFGIRLQSGLPSTHISG